MVSGNHIVALFHRDGCHIVLPVVREQAARALLVEPANILRAGEEDAAHDQAMHALGVGLRVGQGQGRTPGTAEQHPFVDAQVLADALKVGDQIPGGVVLETGPWRRAAAATLVEGDNMVEVRVEIAAALGVATGAGASMDEHDRQAFGGATFIDIQGVGVIDSQIVPGVGFDLRVPSLHCVLRRVSGSSLGGRLLFCRLAS